MTSSAADAPDLSGLIELARDPQLDLKPVVLRVQTDLFLAAPIRDRAVLEAFRLLATGLIPTVDEDTALIVARKLAPCPDTPKAVLVSLAARGGAVYAALLDATAHLRSPVSATAPEAGLAVAPAVSAGSAAEGSAPVAETVSATDPATVSAQGPATSDATAEVEPALKDDMAGNTAGGRIEEPLQASSLPNLIRSARTDADRAGSLLAREDLADADLAPLWLHADRRQRAAIRDAVEATAALRPCPPAQRELAVILTDRSTQHDVTGFVAALAEGLGLPQNFLASAPDASARYDLLALALRAAGLSDSDAIHVFLTLNETVARSVSRVFELAELYRSTSRGAARDLISAILDTPLAEPVRGTAEHRPYLAPEGPRPRAAGAGERALSGIIPTARMRQTG